MPDSTDNGVVIEDLVPGEGEQCPAGATVTVHYTGALEDGKVFDSSVGREPLQIPLERLIKGWQEGIPGMRVGGKRRLTIPSDLAYGDQDLRDNAGNVIIPGGSTLHFEIELLGVV